MTDLLYLNVVNRLEYNKKNVAETCITCPRERHVGTVIIKLLMQERVNLQFYCNFTAFLWAYLIVLYGNCLDMVSYNYLLNIKFLWVSYMYYPIQIINSKKNLYFQTNIRKLLFSCLNLYILMIVNCKTFNDWLFLISFLIACSMMHICFSSLTWLLH